MRHNPWHRDDGKFSTEKDGITFSRGGARFKTVKETGMPSGYRSFIDELNDVVEGCKTPGKKIRSKGKGRGLAVGDGNGPIGRDVDDEEEGCATPGKKIRSKGKGRGLAVGDGKGPVGGRARGAQDGRGPRSRMREDDFGEAKGLVSGAKWDDLVSFLEDQNVSDLESNNQEIIIGEDELVLDKNGTWVFQDINEDVRVTSGESEEVLSESLQSDIKKILEKNPINKVLYHAVSELEELRDNDERFADAEIDFDRIIEAVESAHSLAFRYKL